MTASYRPFALLAELTYRCPLHCAYCSNPTQYPSGKELTVTEWSRVFKEAAELGVLHVGFSGGEPLARPDLSALVAEAVENGLYVNMITSAVGLSPARLFDLAAAGLKSIQISFQAHEIELADRIAGTKAHLLKMEAARAVVKAGLALSLNVVLHRANIDNLAPILELAESLQAVRLELANVQYYGWALLNRNQLLPTREQVEAARVLAEAAKERLAGQMEVVYVLPDYYQDRPKPCMQGWGRRYLTVNPIGQVLPCPNAFSIPNMQFETVREQSLANIWRNSASFNSFRGTDWMPALCRDCSQREIDFGGCRCQASLIVGDAKATDPVCTLSPNRTLIDRAIAEADRSVGTVPASPRINPAA